MSKLDTACAHCGRLITYSEAAVTSAPWKYYHPNCVKEALSANLDEDNPNRV